MPGVPSTLQTLGVSWWCLGAYGTRIKSGPLCSKLALSSAHPAPVTVDPLLVCHHQTHTSMGRRRRCLSWCARPRQSPELDRK